MEGTSYQALHLLAVVRPTRVLTMANKRYRVPELCVIEKETISINHSTYSKSFCAGGWGFYSYQKRHYHC